MLGSGRKRAWVLWLGRHELGALLSLGAFAGGSFAFIEIAEAVTRGSTRAIDRALLLAFRDPSNLSRPLGPPWVEEMGRDLTALGGVAVLTLVSLAVVTHLAFIRKTAEAIFVSVSVLGALSVSLALKRVFERPRPDLVPRLSYVTSSSFPSGHAMLSAAVYLTLGALLARFQQRLAQKTHILAWAILLTLLVGISRVYVGVHWPSDVLAGWAAGAAWAALCWLVARALQHRRGPDLQS